MKLKRNKGFTFIELMVVVAIIGILAAIAIPQFNSYIIRSREASVKILVTEIGSLQREYRGRTGSYISCPINPADGQQEWQAMEAWQKLGFDPQQPIYRYRFKVDAKANSFKVTAMLDGKEVFTTTEKTFQVAQAK